MLPPSAHRVPLNTADSVNEEIRRQAIRDLERYVEADRDELAWRLQELDREWDVERAIEANASSLALVGLLLGLLVTPWFLLLPGLVASFLLQHALQGWCPPVPVLRRFGFRTRREIDSERYVLKYLRGDFKGLKDDHGRPNIAKLYDQASR